MKVWNLHLHQQKKLKFNVSGNNITLAEFVVFEILGYLLPVRLYSENKQKILHTFQDDHKTKQSSCSNKKTLLRLCLF